ncbi:MAG TPA: STAS domain-containing protein [Terriglobales bacterium]|nr:STAS domain-containing protein [Terriglobales bacterium]
MFNVTIERLGQTTVLHCSGRIVFPDADALRKAVVQLPRCQKLVLDLAEVITVDAAGLGVLVSLYLSAKRSRTELKLMNLGSTLQLLLEITKLNTFLESCSVREMLGLLYCSNDDAETSWLVNQPVSTPGPSYIETELGSRIAR